MRPRRQDNQRMKLYQAVQRHCILSLPQLLEDIRRDHQDHHPELEETRVRCPYHGDHHTLRLHDLQLQSPEGGSASDSRSPSPLPSVPSNASPNFCRWHRTSQTWLLGRCGYCQAEMHVHLDAAGKAKEEKVTERCPRCHRDNLVWPNLEVDVWKLKQKDRAHDAVEFMRLESGVPVKQGVLVR